MTCLMARGRQNQGWSPQPPAHTRPCSCLRLSAHALFTPRAVLDVHMFSDSDVEFCDICTFTNFKATFFLMAFTPTMSHFPDHMYSVAWVVVEYRGDPQGARQAWGRWAGHCLCVARRWLESPAESSLHLYPRRRRRLLRNSCSWKPSRQF